MLPFIVKLRILIINVKSIKDKIYAGSGGPLPRGVIGITDRGP
jgi:hypothetical protein